MALHPWLSLDGTSVDQTEFTRLWIIAVATYGVGDVVTTVALMEFSKTVVEANGIIRAAIDAFGQPGLVSLKIAVFLMCISLSVDAANREDGLLYYLPPVALAVVGAFTTALNIRLMYG
ncbi:MAG: hypothetical protein V5A38_10930 [Halolamina sp.]|jgi:hypothetical protein|uniref:hypothetical protein n=1 Tax=Halolamina sp. TaxID=1940283 RepID=UPI002FC30408